MSITHFTFESVNQFHSVHPEPLNSHGEARFEFVSLAVNIVCFFKLLGQENLNVEWFH